MKIAWMPLYPEWGASSRLRVWSIHYELLRRGYDSSIGFDKAADILVVQKHQSFDDNIMCYGGKIIYDGDDREVWGAIPRIIDFVDAVTTDTEGHRQEILEGLTEDKHSMVHVLPDTIDYFPHRPLQPSDGGVCWFGFYGNLPAAEPYLKELSKVTSVRLITNGVERDWAETVGWDLRSFVGTLRASKISLLSHSVGDENKSNNKMITSITYGLPCIVSDTPEYSRLANEAGVEWSIATEPSQALEVYERLKRFDAREEYLSKVQPIVWDKYNIKVATDRFLDLCNAL